MRRNIGIHHNSNLLIKVEHVEEERSSLKFFLQKKKGVKEKVQKINEK
jgi:hypothetical protein